jgi:hypothetical protein
MAAPYLLPDAAPAVLYSPRPWSGGLVLDGTDAGAVRAYDLEARAAAPLEFTPKPSGTTVSDSLGGSPHAEDTYAVGSRVVRYAARRATTHERRVYALDYELSGVEDTDTATPGTAFEHTARTYNALSGATRDWDAPVKLGIEGNLWLEYTDGSSSNTYSPDGNIENEWWRPLGASLFFSPRYQSSASLDNAVGAQVRVVVDGEPTTVHSDILSSGDAYYSFTYATHAWAGGKDYWHVYTCSLEPSLLFWGGSPDYLVQFPVSITTTMRVLSYDGTTLTEEANESLTRTQTDATTFDDETPFVAYDARDAIVVDGETWICGVAYRFSPDTTVLDTYPAQWKPDLSVVREYDGEEFLHERDGSPGPFRLAFRYPGVFGDITVYFAADAQGAHLVLVEAVGDIDGYTQTGRVFTVPVGSDAAPALFVDGDSLTLLHVPPAAFSTVV